jgi:MFS transporter, ACS family, glucarate transporter
MNPATPPPATRVRYGVLAFVCTLSLITYLDRVCISRVQEDISSDLQITDIQMGFIFSAFLVGYTIFEVPGGRLGDRWGARRTLTSVVAWWSLFTMLTGCVWYFSLGTIPVFAYTLAIDSLLLMIVIRFLFGCGEAAAYPTIARVVGNWIPYRERAFAQGTIWMSARLGGAIAAVVIGSLSAKFGWRQAFWILGFFGFVWGVSFWLWFRDRPEDKPQCSAEERALIRSGAGSFSAEEADTAHGPIPWGVLFRSPTMWFVCLAAFCVSFGWYFYPTWQPKFLKEVYKIDYSKSEVRIGLPFLCGAFGCIIGGHLSDRLVRSRLKRRWGRSVIGIFGFGGAGCCVLATGFVKDPDQATALLCAAFFINDLAIPVIWAVAADIGGKHAGTVAGFMNMVGGIGGMIIPVLIPWLKQELPGSVEDKWRGVFMVMASAWFVGALAWFGVDASKPLFRETQAPESAH